MNLRPFVLVALLSLIASTAHAQSLGSFRWQLQPFCNLVTLNVTQNGSIYTLDGFDDQCGAATRAPVTGLATPNPNGTIEFGLAIVLTPSGSPVHVAAAINLATLGGTWRDSAGSNGNFVFTTGNGTAGSPRPVPTAVIPTAFALQSDGGFLAEGTLGQGAIPESGIGTRMMWYTGKAAFRAGQVTVPAWDDLNVGQHSAAFNLDTVASGARSVAFGHNTLASGPNTSAFGFDTKARGAHATAIGTGTQANGFSSFALGTATLAGGDDSFATGFQTQALGAHAAVFGAQSQADGFASFSAGQQTLATGNNSFVLGAFARALAIGSFVFGDASTTTNVVFAPAPNSFTVRADGGTRFFSNAALTAGVVLANGASAWSALSDANTKENFRDLDGGDVLTKLARMPIREWNYKAQAAAIRHVGPTAQDFREAFGLGEDPLRISTIDADGIALAGVQALEARTREQHDALVLENTGLREVVDRLKTEIAALRERLDRVDGQR